MIKFKIIEDDSIENGDQININLGGEEDQGYWARFGISSCFVWGFVFYFLAFITTTGGFAIFEGFAFHLFIIGSVLIVLGIILIIFRQRKKYMLNKLASLIVSSELRRISDIVYHSGMSEKKVIKNLRMLVSNSSTLKLGNDARYLKGAKINLQTMEITLSDKYIEKEDWTCVYCRAVNAATVLICQSCNAPKKRL